jgi:hypothetical protein
VFLPGDNDIGGENEPLSIRKMERFQETFRQPDVMHLGHTDMFKVRHCFLCLKCVNSYLSLLVYICSDREN